MRARADGGILARRIAGALSQRFNSNQILADFVCFAGNFLFADVGEEAPELIGAGERITVQNPIESAALCVIAESWRFRNRR